MPHVGVARGVGRGEEIPGRGEGSGKVQGTLGTSGLQTHVDRKTNVRLCLQGCNILEQ